MRLKSVLFGAICALAVGNAGAADLPPAPHPVDYVRICDAFGSGFFYIPGTDSCLRMRGRVRVDYRYRHQDGDQSIPLGSSSQIASAGIRSDSPVFFRARGYWGWDHRTNTDIGLVRAFLRADIDRDTRDNNGVSLDLDYAFIQIGSLTIGLTDLILEPVFKAYTLDHGWNTTGLDVQAILAQYVYSLDNGFSIGAVIYDQTVAEGGNSMWNVGRAVTGIFAPPTYGGLRIPGAGIAIIYEGSFASFSFSGAVQDVRPDNQPGSVIGYDHAVAWAVNGSAEFKVPVGTKTKVGINAAYTHGILQYLHEDTRNLPTSDFTVNSTLTKTDLSKGWSVGAGLSTQVFERTTFNFTGGYTDVRQNNGVVDLRWFDVVANLQYALTSNLKLTAEGHYRYLDASNNIRSSDGISGILRAQLDF